MNFNRVQERAALTPSRADQIHKVADNRLYHAMIVLKHAEEELFFYLSSQNKFRNGEWEQEIIESSFAALNDYFADKTDMELYSVLKGFEKRYRVYERANRRFKFRNFYYNAVYKMFIQLYEVNLYMNKENIRELYLKKFHDSN